MVKKWDIDDSDDFEDIDDIDADVPSPDDVAQSSERFEQAFDRGGDVDFWEAQRLWENREGIGYASTWWLFNEPNIANMVTVAGDFLDDMYLKFGVKPAEIDGASPKIAEARYEMRKYGEEITYPQAILPEFIGQIDNMAGWMDFLSGVPYGVMEMQIRVGEVSSQSALYPTLSDPGAPVPPIPNEFFDETYEKKDNLYDYLWLGADNVDEFADGLAGEPTTDLLWWLRYNHVLPPEADAPQKFPHPGEFVAVGARLFPDKPWGDQETSPYLFSGNWVDTLYYTSAIVDEIIEPTDMRPFKLYKVKWRGKEEEMDQEDYNKFLARPSGFDEHEVGDRVTILKDAETERLTQTWKDDKEFLEIIWRIAPITFYERPEDWQSEEEPEE